MESGCRKKHQKKTFAKSIVETFFLLKNAFVTGAAFNIKLHSRKINFPAWALVRDLFGFIYSP